MRLIERAAILWRAKPASAAPASTTWSVFGMTPRLGLAPCGANFGLVSRNDDCSDAWQRYSDEIAPNGALTGPDGGYTR